MNPLTRILTAVDFSKPARAAFDHALALSRTHGADLTVVHAVPGDRALEWRARARERITMIEALRQAAEAAGIRLTVIVQRGHPADVIPLHAHVIRPDMIVLGTNQRSGFDRFRLGSVAESVALRATQPVLVIPASSSGTESVMSLNSLLVAVDFNAASSLAVERALSMANANSRVTLVHVVPHIHLASASPYTYHLSEPEYQRLVTRDAWRRLQETVSTNARTSRVHARVVPGDPSTEIARVAADVNADLILVGVTSRSAIGRWIFGSTAARVIRTAGRPVLAIPELVDQAAIPGSEHDQPLAVAA